MPTLRASSRLQNFSAIVSIIAILWNIPDRLLAAQALEIHRPPSAEANLSVSIEEVDKGSYDEEKTYILTFKNLSDHHVTYTRPAFRFPDLNGEPQILTPAEAAQYQSERRTLDSNSHSSGGPYFYHAPSPSSNCKDACIVIVTILIVFVVVILVASVLSEMGRQEKIKQESALSSIPYLDNSISLAPHEELRRRVILRKDPRQKIETIKIEFFDETGATRTFKANMGGRPTS